jgi:hypothetical protein
VVKIKQAIMQRAHEIWLERQESGTPGDELSDWLQAEREISDDDATGFKQPGLISRGIASIDGDL